jgi:hypothetical protein
VPPHAYGTFVLPSRVRTLYFSLVPAVEDASTDSSGTPSELPQRTLFSMLVPLDESVTAMPETLDVLSFCNSNVLVVMSVPVAPETVMPPVSSSVWTMFAAITVFAAPEPTVTEARSLRSADTALDPVPMDRLLAWECETSTFEEFSTSMFVTPKPTRLTWLAPFTVRVVPFPFVSTSRI